MKFKFYHFLFFLFLFPFLIYNYSSVYLLELFLFNSLFMNFSIKFIFDKESMIFAFSVFSIFSSIYYYSLGYMNHPLSKRFMLMLISFFLSMLLMIFGGNLFTSFIGWDSLGVTSFFLILFFSSNSAFHAGYLTFFVNRLGDCFFIISICLSLLYSIDSFSGESFWSLSLFLFLASTTKSAQYPFSSWLPAAMEAPTPVSALVHSSTLVTAGIYLLMRYKDNWYFNDSVTFMLKIVSLITVFMASSSAVIEKDMKKVIALSTLSQLGFIMLVLSFKLSDQAFFHLIMHAYYKALLFMSAGMIIHSWISWQNLSKIYISKFCSPVGTIMFNFSNLCLCGLPFMSGFYSKDNIIDYLWEKDLNFIFFFLVISFFLSVFYTSRLTYFSSIYSVPWGSMSDDDKIMVSSMFYLVILSTFSGSIMMWLMNLPIGGISTSKFNLLCTLILSYLLIMFNPSISLSMMVKYFLYSKWLLSFISEKFMSFFFYIMKKEMLESQINVINSWMINEIINTSKISYPNPLHFNPEIYILWCFLLLLSLI